MSWSQRIQQFGGRWSPFGRSPIAENGGAQVKDADFSYITADDLQNGDYDRNDSGPPRETDVLTIKNNRNTYQIHFPAHSIDRGELLVKDVRDQVAQKTGSNHSRIKLVCRGKKLNDDSRTCREEGLRAGSDILCIVSDAPLDAPSSSDSDDADGLDGAADPEKTKRKRNRTRNKKKKGKKRGPVDGVDSDGLAVPGSETSRNASPKPPTPATPADKLNALTAKLGELVPQCKEYITHPPSDKTKRDFDYKRLSETVLAQVLLKLDAVETDEPDLRARRKELVRETQKVLSDLDAAKGS